MGIYYDLESTNGTLDVAYLKFNEVKTLTVELTEVETSVIRLAEAIQKTQKRANALGNVQIPQMQRPSSPSTRCWASANAKNSAA